MVRLVAAVAAVAFIVASSAAIASDPTSSTTETAAAPTTTASTADESAASDRVICKSSVPIGTRLGKKKTCMTAREWSDLRAQTRGVTERIQTQGLKDQ